MSCVIDVAPQARTTDIHVRECLQAETLNERDHKLEMEEGLAMSVGLMVLATV